MNENDLFFSRTELLIGREAMLRMERARVILFGVGGVGEFNGVVAAAAAFQPMQLHDAGGLRVGRV